MGRPISYNAYVREYYAEAAKHEMYAPMFDEATFEAVYEGMANTLRERGMRVQNITRQIIQKQAYEISFKQAKAFRNARNALGMEKVSLKTIRSMGKAEAVDWGLVRAKYHEYKDAVEELQAAEEKLAEAEASGDATAIAEAEAHLDEVEASIDPEIMSIIEQTRDAEEGEFVTLAEEGDLNDNIGLMDASQYIAQVIFGSE